MAEIVSGEITVHEIDVATQCRVVRSCVYDISLAAADQRATPVRATELLGLRQTRRNRRCSDGINGACQGIQDADLEPFPPLRSEILIRRPRGEFRDAFGLALPADNGLRLFGKASRASGLPYHARLLSNALGWTHRQTCIKGKPGERRLMPPSRANCRAARSLFRSYRWFQAGPGTRSGTG